MRTVRLRSRFASEDAHRDFGRVAEFGLFPSLAEDVRAVEVHPAPSPEVQRDSDWEVNFRRGIMRWNEWESVDAERLRIEFEQTGGDFSDFHGFWQLTPSVGGCEVLFEVTYDFGIESLAGIMDPIAERVVKRVICSVLTGLFGEIHVLEGGEALVDLAGLIASDRAGGVWTEEQRRERGTSDRAAHEGRHRIEARFSERSEVM